MTNTIYSDIEIDHFLSDTRSLVSKMVHVSEDFGLVPSNDHKGTAIAYSDLLEMHDEFINELTNGIIRYIYSKDKEDEIVGKLVSEGREVSNAYTELLRRSHNKFRTGDLKGQFSELLIFYLLQHYFKAVPVLRKMKITTNPALERNGADAIHLAKQDGKLKLFLAECKTYDAKENNFQNAFHNSLNDILSHYSGHRSELDLYTFEDFIPDELERITRDYLEGKLEDIEVNLVCMVTYRNDEDIKGNNKWELEECTINSIRENASKIRNDLLERKIPKELWPRIHYVFFPLNDVELTLDKFRKRISG